MFLGTVTSHCHRCGKDEGRTALGDFRHDLRCWGVRTAGYNLWVRLTDPDWFREEAE